MREQDVAVRLENARACVAPLDDLEPIEVCLVGAAEIRKLRKERDQWQKMYNDLRGELSQRYEQLLREDRVRFDALMRERHG